MKTAPDYEATVDSLTEKMGLTTRFQDTFELPRLPDTCMTPHKEHGGMLCFLVCCFLCWSPGCGVVDQ